MRRFSLLVLLTLVSSSVVAAYVDWNRPAPETLYEHEQVRREEIHRIRIENETDGSISISIDGGETFVQVGKVVYPATATRQGYRASGWAETGTVAATAAHAIHLKADHSDTGMYELGNGFIFSLIPRDFGTPPSGHGGYVATNNGIFTNITAGTGIFGPWTPFVGSQVALQTPEGVLPIPKGYTPSVGDVLQIIVDAPVRMPEAIIFHNTYGGLIEILYPDGERKPVAVTLQPVIGVGRFDGTSSTGHGGINTNHTGVITVSSAPVSAITDVSFQAGFQIIPAHHINNRGVDNPRMTPIMVVGPVDARDPSPDGIAPLFSGYLRPAFGHQDRSEGYVTLYSTNNGRHWRDLPQLRGYNADILGSMTHFKIVFPTRQPELGHSPPKTPQIPEGLPGETRDWSISFEGFTSPGARVEIFHDGVKSGEYYADAAGRFFVHNYFLDEGENSLRLQAVDAVDRVSEMTPEYTVNKTQ